MRDAVRDSASLCLEVGHGGIAVAVVQAVAAATPHSDVTVAATIVVRASAVATPSAERLASRRLMAPGRPA